MQIWKQRLQMLSLKTGRIYKLMLIHHGASLLECWRKAQRVTLCWQKQPWFSQLKMLTFTPSSYRPTWVPGSHTISQLQLPSSHNSFSVGCMEVLRQQLRAEGFQKELSLLHEGRGQTPHTTLLGINRRGCVLHGIQIPFQDFF